MSLLRRPDICPRSSLPKAETPEEQDAFSVFVHVLYSVDNPKPVRVFKYLTRAEVRFQNRIIASLDEWKAIQEELIYIGYSVTEQAIGSGPVIPLDEVVIPPTIAELPVQNDQNKKKKQKKRRYYEPSKPAVSSKSRPSRSHHQNPKINQPRSNQRGYGRRGHRNA